MKHAWIGIVCLFLSACASNGSESGWSLNEIIENACTNHEKNCTVDASGQDAGGI